MKVVLEFELMGDFYDLPDEKLVDLVLSLYGKGEICKLKGIERSQQYKIGK